MALVIPDDCANWLVTILNTGGGASQKSSIGFGTSNASALDQTIVDRVSNLFRDNLKTMWDNNWGVGPIHVVERQGNFVYVWDNTTAELGTHSADTYAPPQVATVVSKQTGISGRSKRGRLYLPGVPAGYVGEDGNLNPAHVTAVQAAIDATFIAVIGDAAINTMALFHDESSPNPEAWDIIQSFRVRTVAGTMRPRLRR